MATPNVIGIEVLVSDRPLMQFDFAYVHRPIKGDFQIFADRFEPNDPSRRKIFVHHQGNVSHVNACLNDSRNCRLRGLCYVIANRGELIAAIAFHMRVL